MRKFLFGLILFFGLASIAGATLPNDLASRQKESYTETDEGNVALRIKPEGDLSLAGYVTATGFYTSDGNEVGGGSGTPGGSTKQIQYNNNGSFGGESALAYNASTNSLSLSGNMSIANSLTFTEGYTILDGTMQSINSKIEQLDAIPEYFESDGSGGVSTVAGLSTNVTIGSNMTINGVLYARGGLGGGSLKSQFDVVAGDDVGMNDDLTVGDDADITGDLTVGGELFALEAFSIPLDMDFSVTGADGSASYLFAEPFPFVKGIVKELRLSVSQPLDGQLTVSVGRMRSGTFTELTGATTRPFATSTNEIGSWETGLLFQFLDTDYLAVKLHSFTRIDDLTRTGVSLNGKVQVINVDD